MKTLLATAFAALALATPAQAFTQSELRAWGASFREAGAMAWPAGGGEVHTRKRHGAWGRNGLVSQARARELWRQHRQKGWLPEA